METNSNQAITISEESVISKIYQIRGMKIMLDEYLAKFYNIETRVLNQAVSRNIARFPEDFMFTLTEDEYLNLKSQNVMPKWGGRSRMKRSNFYLLI